MKLDTSWFWLMKNYDPTVDDDDGSWTFEVVRLQTSTTDSIFARYTVVGSVQAAARKAVRAFKTDHGIQAQVVTLVP